MGVVWGYVRVSTDEQDNSVANQKEKIAEFAAKEKLDLAEIFVDEDVTARIPLRNRPKGRIMWDAMNSGDTVIFNKVDRVFRSVRDAAETVHIWQEKGIRCVIMDLGIDLATPAGRMFFHQLASFAEFEREMIGQRTREIAAYLRKHGRPFGSARPFGWLRLGTGKDSRYVPCDSERETCSLVLRLQKQGLSFRQIVWELAKSRVTKPGKKPTDQGKGVWYCASEVHGMAQAARLGFPIAPRAALQVSAMQLTPT
jgi:DNA invertase Pin-like site-specific DNA recombinase